MKTHSLFFGLLIILLGGSVIALPGEWFPGLVHNHSDFSDGSRTAKMVIGKTLDAGCKYLIETEHYEEINSTKPALSNMFKCHGFENYHKSFSSDKLVIICGVEVQTIRYDTVSHTLVLGEIEDDPDLNLIQNQMDAQQKVITCLKNKGFLVVAAHPHLFSAVAVKWKPWEGTSAYYNKDEAEGLDGIEFFNDGQGDSQKTLDWYLSLVVKKKNVFVTTGCDSHVPADPDEINRWTRKTWVWADILTKGSLLESFRKGNTYVSWGDVSIKEINYVPSFEVQDVDRPIFNLTLKFKRKSVTPRKLRVYCDGKLVMDSEQTISMGKKEYHYEWTDNDIGVGEHWYVVELEGSLLTSPIKLKVGRPVTSEKFYNEWQSQAIASSSSINDFLSGKGRSIAYLSDRSGEPELYFKDTQNNAILKICSMSGYLNRYEVSPGGNVLLVNKKDGGINVSMPDKDNFGKRKVIKLNLKSSFDSYPSWANDNSFYYTPAGAKENRIKLVEFSVETVCVSDVLNFPDLGGILNTLKSAIKKDIVKTKLTDPVNLKFITAKKNENGFWQICLVNSDNTVNTWLTKGNYDNGSPSVASGTLVPIGTPALVVFISNRNGNYDLYTLATIDGKVSDEKRVTTFETDELDPAWLYNSSKIIFSCKEKDGQTRLKTIDY